MDTTTRLKKLRKSKIAIIGTVGVPAKYGGFETLAEYLLEELNDKYAFTVYCSGPHYENERKSDYLGAKLKYVPFNANGKSSILYDFLCIMHALFYADVLLILGVSAGFMIPIVRLFTRKKIITNIDGLEWKRDKWGGFAKRYLKSQEKIAVRYSSATVVDNKGIQDYVKSEYNKPSVLIAYGADHVTQEKLTESTKSEFNIPDLFAFKVARIEPENNIHIILEAFSTSKINLVIVGNWDNSEYGSSLKQQYSGYSNIHILDPIYNQKKLNEFRSNCILYVHGHSAGGTNPSLVEAMYLGLPIVAFDVNYNKYTTHDKALYFETSQDLSNLLNNEITEQDRLQSFASDMKKVALEEYLWKTISENYAILFDS